MKWDFTSILRLSRASSICMGLDLTSTWDSEAGTTLEVFESTFSLRFFISFNGCLNPLIELYESTDDNFPGTC